VNFPRKFQIKAPTEENQETYFLLCFYAIDKFKKNIFEFIGFEIQRLQD
jgi:hypothetical protein